MVDYFFFFLYLSINQSIYLSIYLSIPIYIYLPVCLWYFTTEEFLKATVESWDEWDLNSEPLNSVQTVEPTDLAGYGFNFSQSEPTLHSYSNFISFFTCSRFILVFVLVSRHICFKWSLAQVITLVGEWTDTFGIHHWKIFRNSYGKLAWVGFEPTTTEFCSDSLTDWDMRPWVQLSLRNNFVQPLQFHLFLQCSRLISVFAFVSHQISFKQSLTQVITLVAESIDAYGIHHWRVFRSSYRKLAWLGFELTTTEFHYIYNMQKFWLLSSVCNLSVRAGRVLKWAH